MWHKTLLSILFIFFLTPIDAFTTDGISSNGAVLRWTQHTPGWACLYRADGQARILIDCHERQAGQHEYVLLPHTGRDAAYVPRGGDMYVIEHVGLEVRAPLRWRAWLPQISR